jgi:chromate transporter
MGVWGAAVATVGMFLPPGLLTIYCSRFFDVIRSSSAVQAIFKGVRAVVIGMIISAAFIIGKDLDMVWQSFLLGGAALGFSIFTNINLIYLIVVSGILGIVLF